MKCSLLLGSMFAILICAVISNGQHTRLLIGTEGGLWRGAGDGFATMSARAGQTIRLRIASTNNRGKLIVGVDDTKMARGTASGKVFVATEAGVYQIPCDGTAGRSLGVSAAQLTITGQISDATYNWKTDPVWKGTCRMLTVKLRDGTEVRAKVRFE